MVLGAKSALREGCLKKHERREKKASGNVKFWDVKTFQNYALGNEFMIFSESEKVCKSMPKWLPKVIQNL